MIALSSYWCICLDNKIGWKEDKKKWFKVVIVIKILPRIIVG